MNAPLTNDDRLPDDRAVWRDPPGPQCPGFISITVEYAGGFRERTTVRSANWRGAVRWRFGWAPMA